MSAQAKTQSGFGSCLTDEMHFYCESLKDTPYLLLLLKGHALV